MRAPAARHPLRGVVGRPRPRAVGVAPDHVARADPEPRDDLADAVQVAAAQRRTGEVAVERPEPGGVERGDGGDVAGAERRRAHRAPAPTVSGQRDPGARGGARTGGQHGALAALRERAHPGVQRGEHRLVVVRGRARLGQPHDPARHRARREPLERRDGRVQVGVVAVDRVDVVAQPDARVDEPHPRRRGVGGQRRGERARPRPARCAARGRGSPTARSPGARRSSPRRARGRGCRR